MMHRGMVGRPKKLPEQKRTERVVALLTSEERQWLKGYTGEQSMSQALREAISVLPKLSPQDRRKFDRLNDLDSFIYAIEEKLRKGDIELTIESKTAVIKIGRGRISFGIPQKPVKKEIVMQALRELEQRCESLKEGPVTGGFIFQDDRFRYVAPRIMDVAGYKSERLLNEPVFDLVHPDDRGKVEELVQKGLKEREFPLGIKFRALRNDGGIIYVNATAISMEYEGRTAIVGSLAVLTEWDEVQQELRKLGRIIGRG